MSTEKKAFSVCLCSGSLDIPSSTRHKVLCMGFHLQLSHQLKLSETKAIKFAIPSENLDYRHLRNVAYPTDKY